MTGNYEKRDGEIFSVTKVKVTNIKRRIKELEADRDHAREQITLWSKTLEKAETKLAELTALVADTR